MMIGVVRLYIFETALRCSTVSDLEVKFYDESIAIPYKLHKFFGVRLPLVMSNSPPETNAQSLELHPSLLLIVEMEQNCGGSRAFVVAALVLSVDRDDISVTIGGFFSSQWHVNSCRLIQYGDRELVRGPQVVAMVLQYLNIHIANPIVSVRLFVEDDERRCRVDKADILRMKSQTSPPNLEVQLLSLSEESLAMVTERELRRHENVF